MQKYHPLRGTVSRLIFSLGRRKAARNKTGEGQRKLKKEKNGKRPKLKKKARKPKKKPESDFVKFMNRLETRGPEGPWNLYDKWTVAIRERMTERGTWPTGNAKWNLNTLAQYMQELQREFWNAMPKILKKKALRHNCGEHPWRIENFIFDLVERGSVAEQEKEDMYELLERSADAFEMLHNKIRMKGLRGRKFCMATCKDPRSLTRIYLGKMTDDTRALKWAWRSYHWNIMHLWSFKIPPPILVMPHVIKRINVCINPRVRKDAFINKGEVIRF